MEIESCSKLYKVNCIVVLNNTYSEPTRVTRRISARKNTGRNKATFRMAIFFASEFSGQITFSSSEFHGKQQFPIFAFRRIYCDSILNSYVPPGNKIIFFQGSARNFRIFHRGNIIR